MPANYAHGKIYAIRSRSRLDLVYIGSTTQVLSKRYSNHLTDFRAQKKNLSSSLVIEIGDSCIELFEAFPCADKEELRRREGQVQRSMKCVNRQIAGRTLAEWRAENMDYNRSYYLNHKAQQLQTAKERYQLKKEHVAVMHKEPFRGATVTHGNRSTHLKSLKHLQAAAILDFIYS